MENILEPFDSEVNLFNVHETLSAQMYPGLPSPAVSVIIPVYNAEKYIGECLDGILAQTFHNFELILVDDCSTDKSCKVIKSYMPKFNGRLKLYSTENNFGSGAVARNIGLSHAGGEYVFNMDNDDLITKTALEEMYTLAKEYDADVVYCEKYYMSTGKGKKFKDNIHLADSRIQEPPFVDKPTFESEDFNERVQELLDGRFWVAPWLKLVRREILDKNKLFFPPLKIADDDIWTYVLLFFAKKFLRVPNMIYIRRMRDDSLSLADKTPQQTITFWLSPILFGLKELDRYMGQIEFFQENPQQRYAILEKFFQSKLRLSFNDASELPQLEVYETIMNEFGENFGEYAALVSALCTHICDQHKTLKANKKGLKLFKKDWEIKDLKADISLKSSLASPAISVIIPLYNVEEYVGECLDSLLDQTFQDFEVIVVDDCSTDNSVEVVKSYAPKFEGRLTVAQLEKNAGYAGFPRNKGIELAHGKYLYFFDPDDTISPTALEELYSAAEMFNAEVVHCEKYYTVPDEFYHDAEYRKNLKPQSWPMGEKRFITQPTLLTDDFEKRVKEFSNGWLQWASWMQFIRRDFLVDNGIRFLNIYSQDMIFTMCELCCAKNYLVVPNVVYYWRRRKGSKTQDKLDASQMVHRYVLILRQGIGYLDEFLSRQEFFAERTDLKYVLFNMIFIPLSHRFDKVYADHTTYKIDDFLRREFAEDSAFTSFAFNTMNTYRLPSAQKQLFHFNRFANSAQKELAAPENGQLITVIIPLYNAEKYIAECLDSLLAQTFKNFEVIVVDDCSTDNGVEIVKIYEPQFNGRLRLYHTEKNSGSPGEPCNIGLTFSHGEYLFIMDDDDTITPDALEKLYTDAKNFDADVVTCEKFYKIPEASWDDIEFRKKLKPTSYQKGGFVREPTLIPFDIAQRVQDCSEQKFLRELWTKLIRRDFLIKNEFRFTNNILQDKVAIYCLLCSAEKFVRSPHIINFYRVREDSFYRQQDEPLQQVKTYLKALNVGFKYLDDFLGKREFFRQNPEIKQDVLNSYLKETWDEHIREFYGEITASDRNAALHEEFSDDDNTVLTEFLCHISSELENLREAPKILDKFSDYFTSRIDVEWTPAIPGADFPILHISDNKANVSKPEWLQKKGVGYIIQSYAGTLNIVAKACGDGQCWLKLKGLDVRDPKDNSKRIPYWIDYTKLEVNGQIIFDTLTPAWHDKPYRYKMDLKAGEEITIQIEWLPHRSDT